jgi:molecular chaperone GrpE
MPEPAPPGVAGDPAVAGAQADLTAGALEPALADFRRWFQEAVAANGEAPPAEPAPESIDLATLLSHYVALRQEVNLQTRAVRAQQEQTADIVRQLGQAVEALSRSPGQEDKLRPVLMTLVELYDALALANRETRRTEDNVLPLLEEMAEDDEEEPSPPARSFWSRLFGSHSEEESQRARQERGRKAREATGRVRAALSALVTGYTMSLDRLERALRKHGLEPLEAAGGAFDPERMEVLEAVAGSGRPAGEVLEEVRRGYLYNGRLFRAAQVRVARNE